MEGGPLGRIARNGKVDLEKARMSHKSLDFYLLAAGGTESLQIREGTGVHPEMSGFCKGDALNHGAEQRK